MHKRKASKMTTQWIKGDWTAPNGGYHNINDVVATGLDTYEDGWATTLYIANNHSLADAQFIFLLDNQADAQAKAAELAGLTGAVLS